MRPADLKEYFERELNGESMSSDPMMMPKGDVRDEEAECAMKGDKSQRILDRGARLGGGNCIVFLSISEEEFATCSEALLSNDLMLPLDLRGTRDCCMKNDLDTPGCWLALLCPSSFLRVDGQTDRLVLDMPDKME